jgi:hypothetical protein
MPLIVIRPILLPLEDKRLDTFLHMLWHWQRTCAAAYRQSLIVHGPVAFLNDPDDHMLLQSSRNDCVCITVTSCKA